MVYDDPYQLDSVRHYRTPFTLSPGSHTLRVFVLTADWAHGRPSPPCSFEVRSSAVVFVDPAQQRLNEHDIELHSFQQDADPSQEPSARHSSLHKIKHFALNPIRGSPLTARSAASEALRSRSPPHAQDTAAAVSSRDTEATSADTVRGAWPGIQDNSSEV